MARLRSKSMDAGRVEYAELLFLLSRKGPVNASKTELMYKYYTNTEFRRGVYFDEVDATGIFVSDRRINADRYGSMELLKLAKLHPLALHDAYSKIKGSHALMKGLEDRWFYLAGGESPELSGYYTVKGTANGKLEFTPLSGDAKDTKSVIYVHSGEQPLGFGVRDTRRLNGTSFDLFACNFPESNATAVVGIDIKLAYSRAIEREREIGIKPRS